MLGLVRRLFGKSRTKRSVSTAYPRTRSATGDVLAQKRVPVVKNGAHGEAGFDPYNTGKFDRAASWERVSHSHR